LQAIMRPKRLRDQDFRGYVPERSVAEVVAKVAALLERSVAEVVAKVAALLD